MVCNPVEGGNLPSGKWNSQVTGYTQMTVKILQASSRGVWAGAVRTVLTSTHWAEGRCPFLVLQSWHQGGTVVTVSGYQLDKPSLGVLVPVKSSSLVSSGYLSWGHFSKVKIPLWQQDPPIDRWLLSLNGSASGRWTARGAESPYSLGWCDVPKRASQSSENPYGFCPQPSSTCPLGPVRVPIGNCYVKDSSSSPPPPHTPAILVLAVSMGRK